MHTKLRTRQLGHSAPTLPPLGSGAWAIGGDWTLGWVNQADQADQADQDATAATQPVLDLGINGIALYGLGHFNDWGRQSSEFQEPYLSRNLKLVERLEQIGIQHDCSAGVAIAWTLTHLVVTGVLVGDRNSHLVAGLELLARS